MSLCNLLIALEPPRARRLGPALMSWEHWTGDIAHAFSQALRSPELQAHIRSGPPYWRERWKSALVSLYSAELVGRLRGGEGIVDLIDRASVCNRTDLPITRFATALHMGPATIHARIPATVVVDAGTLLLKRADPDDRIAGAELVRLNASRLEGRGRRQAALRSLLDAGFQEQSPRTFFFLADGIATLNALVSDDARATVGDLKRLYEARGCRWRAMCLVAATDSERQAELARLVDLLSSETNDADAVGAVRAALTLGGEAIQLKALSAWTMRGGSREPDAFSEMALLALWRSSQAREAVQRRLLHCVTRAAEQRDPNPSLASVVHKNGALLRSGKLGFRMAKETLRWALTLDDDGFWRVLLAWAHCVSPDRMWRSLGEAIELCPPFARDRLRALACVSDAERRSMAASWCIGACAHEAAWWRYVHERPDS
jgi:hypothetical protein